MVLEELQVRGIRNLESVDWMPQSGLNYLEGANGTGKTSLLEAIFILGRGRSFRERAGRPVVGDGQETATVYGRFSDGQGAEVRIGVEKSKGATEARINGESAKGISELAVRNPVALFNTRSVELLEGSPEARRRFLDWGVFHVEHSYREAAERYRRALRQRNTAIRQSARAIRHWDGPLAEAGEAIQSARQSYFSRLLPLLESCLLLTLPDLPIEVSLIRGWGDQSLAEALDRSFSQDVRNGFTGCGPHRADLDFRVAKSLVKDRLSRGQLKLLVAGLVLSQAKLIMEVLSDSPILLFDDYRAELDPSNRVKLTGLLSASGCQCVLTGSEPPEPDTPVSAVFHVEHGRIT